MHTTGSLEVVTIERLFQEWAEYEDQKIKSLRDRGLPPHIEPHTHHQYKGLVRNHLLPRAANWQLRDITVGKLDRLFLEILNDGSSSAAEKIRAIMSRMFRYAMHQDWIALTLCGTQTRNSYEARRPSRKRSSRKRSRQHAKPPRPGRTNSTPEKSLCSTSWTS